MADAEQEPGTSIFYRTPNDEFRFVTGVDVTAGKMVYLNFAQHNASETDEEALGIVRLVMHPDLAADLIEKLSGLQDS